MTTSTAGQAVPAYSLCRTGYLSVPECPAKITARRYIR
jgi:hypothetical protein